MLIWNKNNADLYKKNNTAENWCHKGADTKIHQCLVGIDQNINKLCLSMNWSDLKFAW